MSEPITTFQAPTGTHDVLGPASAQWEGLVATFAQFAYRFGFELAVTPMFEEVGVFNRGIGEDSEVAKKEMYVFSDRSERIYALRPEGTAPIVRAFVQHSPTTPWKAWYVTPAFRYERPQAGRYRQHHQLGVEVLGTDDPAVDVEVIALAQRFYEAIGLTQVRLMVNSMGHDECRAQYVERLRKHLLENAGGLCADHADVWHENPLRVLDCKKQPCIAVTSTGPMLIDHICDDCRAHFDKVVAGLSSIGIDSTLNPRLVRGFDYYTRTTFEFVAEALDSAATTSSPSSWAASPRAGSASAVASSDSCWRARPKTSSRETSSIAPSTSSSSTPPTQTSPRFWSTSCVRPASRPTAPTTDAR
jgi:histidyl-tRNA synthetase